MARKPLNFILPERAAVARAAAGGTPYALQHYYGRGPIAAAKRNRFQRALALAEGIAADSVIDMGCADGLLLPTLATHFRRVAAIDLYEAYCARARRLAAALDYANVQVHCNGTQPMEAIGRTLGGGWRLMFMLEVLEHVGRQPDMWGTKMAFLDRCFELLEPDGRIVISVPKMVGPGLFAKHLLQRLTGRRRDALTWPQVLRSAFLYDTEALEPLWDGRHVGFNHRKLEQRLARAYRIEARRESGFTVFYRIGRNGGRQAADAPAAVRISRTDASNP